MTNTIDHGLRHDIRLLGQLLGEILRGHEGEALYAKVEDIRQTALRFRREETPPPRGGSTRCYAGLSRDETIGVVRAFSYFSHLANIAEDRHLVRRQQAEGAARAGLARACDGRTAGAHGIGARRLASLLADACLMPVLTAHPTEVRRKSILDAERAIAALIEARDVAGKTAQRHRR